MPINSRTIEAQHNLKNLKYWFLNTILRQAQLDQYPYQDHLHDIQSQLNSMVTTINKHTYNNSLSYSETVNQLRKHLDKISREVQFILYRNNESFHRPIVKFYNNLHKVFVRFKTGEEIRRPDLPYHYNGKKISSSEGMNLIYVKDREY